MVIRKDGIDTQEKLLKAASEVFAEKGCQNTTVAEIGRRAGSNVAAVNYHFGNSVLSSTGAVGLIICSGRQ